MRRAAGIVTAGAFLLAAVSLADPLSTHARLDWNAPYRWVHVDNVRSGGAAAFEQARKGWLRALHRGDSLLADGRPLFWVHRDRELGRNTYYTFYPFTRFAELDARREAVRGTQAAVGKPALERYDAADSVLVPPHVSRIWRRSPDDDYVLPGGEALNERNASAGKIETRAPEFFSSTTVDSLWSMLLETLAAERYPLTCRVFQDVYGSSDVYLMWLAPDAAAMRAAPSLEDVVSRRLGADRASKFWNEMNRVFPVTSTITVERSAELSNLGSAEPSR